MSKATSAAAKKKTARTKKPKPKSAAKTERAPRTDSKQSKLIEMLKRPEGVTIAEVVEALQWQAHTIRGAIAGALKKKLGLKVESEKVDADRGRVYRITE
jgi:predicted HTH transcriptional regulator